MKIAICSDHRGYKLKENIIKKLQQEGYLIRDYGTNNDNPVDYPDLALKLCEGILNKKTDFGIAICGTGIGISIACNKVVGIRCAKVCNLEEIELARSHNDVNVIAISCHTDIENALKMIKMFLKTEFSNEERHIIRINKIKEYELGNLYE